MNKLTKRILSVFLAIAMIVTILPTVTTEAATKTKTCSLVLYKGESIRLGDNLLSTVKKVSTSKKSIVSVAKDKQRNYYANAVARKAGKAVVMVETKYTKTKYTITVKNPAFDVKFKKTGDDKFLMIVKNKNKDYFDSVDFTYVLRDENGEVVEKKTIRLSYLLPGKYAYYSISAYDLDVDASQCTATSDSYYRYIDAKYVNLCSKVITKVTETQLDDAVELSVKMTNKAKKSDSRGCIYILLYDENDTLLGMKSVYASIDAGGVKTEKVKVHTSPYSEFANYHHYKVVPSVYAKIF